MSNEAKNLDELFYFAQTLLKEVQEKKKELKLKNNEKSNSVMSIFSIQCLIIFHFKTCHL